MNELINKYVELINKYVDFINFIDPFWEAYTDADEVIEIELPAMLYNLEEIKKNNGLEGEYLDRLNEVINAFKAEGISYDK